MAQQTLEEAAEELYPTKNMGSMFMPNRDELNNSYKQEAFIEGAKWKEIVDSEQFLETISFENVEWVMQFDNDEPIAIATMGDTKGEEKEFVIRIGNNNNSNIHFSDGKGKSLKIFAREIKEKL